MAADFLIFVSKRGQRCAAALLAIVALHFVMASCINESANARGEAVCVLGALPLPRSLTRCARSFGCGERYQLTQRR